jgi:tryptophan-rich sensory protein
MNPILRFILCLALPLAVGAIGGFATASGVDGWYTTIEKPSFNPPNWIFGPVWTTLYVLMGIGFFRITGHAPSRVRHRSIVIFSIQLFFNLLWRFLFFYFHEIGWAFVDILLNWISIVGMITIWSRIDKPAAWMQVPLLLWVTFASVLNGTILALN